MRAKAVDRNQPEIVSALRKAGVSVQILSAVGQGCPDILAGYNEVSYPIEIKMPGGKLTDDQRVWHSEWKGKVWIVYSAEEALRIVKHD